MHRTNCGSLQWPGGIGFWLLLCASLWMAGQSYGQSELGCCQFMAKAGAITAQRCATLTRSQCDALRPFSTFFRGQRCDSIRQRCVFQVASTPAPSPTLTMTPPATPSPTPTPEAKGCCEVAASRAVSFPFCGNQIPASVCFEAFGFRASFCADCTCSASESAGFHVVPGACVAPTPLPPTVPPTRTPTRAPSLRSSPRSTLTPPPTATPAVGCCEIPVSSGQKPAAFCGNAVARAACLQSFPGAVFCPNCRCSSHSEPGFGTRPGRCVPQRPMHAPRPPRR
jgi:hypothetical protein